MTEAITIPSILIPPTICFPVTASVMELHDQIPIGVTIDILVLTEHVNKLPDCYKRAAEALFVDVCDSGQTIATATSADFSDRDTTTICFPVAKAHVDLAGDKQGKVIGVSIRILVTARYVKELPDSLRNEAEALLEAWKRRSEAT